MNCNKFWHKSLEESGIHGFPYLVHRKLHWLEKVFWGTIIILSAYFSISICLNQWERFRDNPIVYAMELTWGKSNYPFVGITLCSESVAPEDVASVIQDIWKVTEAKNITKFKYYKDFLGVLNSLDYLSLQKLKPYEKDLTLITLKYTDILLRLRRQYLPTEAYENTNAKNDKTEIAKYVPDRADIYAAAMTEVGICHTTSQSTRYTNPFGSLRSLRVSPTRYCDFINECNTKFLVKTFGNASFLIFLHNVEDIVTPYERGTIMRNGSIEDSLWIHLLLSLTTAETEVRNLPIAYRKCRYKDENNLRYFQTYRPSFCRIECRINSAMQKCGCKPYFYMVAPHLPVCNIKGMLCLTNANWPEVAQCTCYKLCEEESYISSQSTAQRSDPSRFESIVIIRLVLPRLAMKRRVVFSTDQLIMSFGGAIGLFLGASFISVYALFYVLSEYVFGNIWSFLKKTTKAKHHGRK